MKAIYVKQPGSVDELHLEERPTPTFGPNEILVQVKAVGINYIDIYIRTGIYKIPTFPYIPGKEASGVIVGKGANVSDFKEGDRVAFCFSGSGTYAEFVAIPADQVVLIPDAISYELAAASMLQGLTAYYLTHQTYPLEKNKRVLIHSGAGGVGLLLIQMAKILDAYVITTVSTPAKAELAKKAGADEVVLYTKDSFYEAVMKYTQKQGVDVVYDAVGKTTFDDSLKSLAFLGMLVSYGQASGPIPLFSLDQLAEKSLFLTRPTLFHYIRTKDELTKMASALFSLIEQQKLKVTIGQRYALSEAAKAQADLESRKTIGKSILTV